MKRIVIVGTTGSGKSTLGKQLSDLLSIPHIELDGLYWGANWTPVGDDVFLERVSKVVGADEWVIDGNYRGVRDIVWGRADTLIWLNYPLWVNMWRLLKRSVQRSLRQENLWGTGNTESLYKHFFTSDSLFLWALKTYWRRKKEYPMLMTQPQYTHLKCIEINSQKELNSWLEEVV